MTVISSGTIRSAVYSLVALCVTLTTSCERRPLEDPESFTNVRVVIETDNISNINCDIYNDKIPVPDLIPEVMHVLFFEEEGDDLVTEVYISNRETSEEGKTVISGNMQIYPGSYRMMTYNFGTESTIIRDYDSWSDAIAYTNTVSDNISMAYKSRASDDSKVPDEENIVYEPDHLFLHSDASFEIPYHYGTHTIEVTANTVIDTYYLQIKVEGLEYVSSAQAFLSSMASGYRLSGQERITEPQNTVYFSLQKSDDKGVPVICNIFNTFGHVDNQTNRLIVTFDVRTKDGRSLQYDFDITDVFNTPDAIDHNWLLIEETIKIDPPENPPVSGGGMDPSVSDWEDERYEIFL